MSKILVTGAGGFIGSHLVELLVQEGHEVRAYLRYNSRGSRGNLEDLPQAALESVEVVWGDLRDAESVRRAVEGCAHVMHLGALIAIPYSYVNPTDYVQVNAVGTTNILNAARASTSLERIVVTSTSEVYGTAQYVPIDERHPLQGQSPYSASKIAADYLAESYYRSFDLPVGILRPFNTYGPRQSMRAIIPTIIVQLLTQPTVKLGNLEPRRDLTYVKDTARGFLKMLTADIPFGTPINIGNGSDISIGELLEKLRLLTDSDATLEIEEQRVRPEKSEVTRLLAATELAEAKIGWFPQYTLDQGLGETVDWIRGHLARFRPTEYRI